MEVEQCAAFEPAVVRIDPLPKHLIVVDQLEAVAV